MTSESNFVKFIHQSTFTYDFIDLFKEYKIDY